MGVPWGIGRRVSKSLLVKRALDVQAEPRMTMSWFSARAVPPASVLLLATCAGGGGGGSTYVKSYGDPELEYHVNDAIATSDGGTIMAGFVESTQTVSGQFSRGLVVTKTDGAGNVVWSRQSADFRGNGFQLRSRGPVVQAPDGGYWVAGESNEGASVVKLDARGRFLWQRHYGNRVIRDMKPTLQGGFILAGATLRSAYPQLWLLRANGDGQPQREVEDVDPSDARLDPERAEVAYAVGVVDGDGFAVAGERGFAAFGTIAQGGGHP
jgi:hypothetical protein